MLFKNYINKISNFIIRRLAELVGIFLVTASILLFISLISYSPEDPNFIFPENQNIKKFKICEILRLLLKRKNNKIKNIKK